MAIGKRIDNKPMKDLNESHLGIIAITPERAASQLDTALRYLFDDRTKGYADFVVGDYAYEELISALLSARAALQRSDHGTE